MRRIVVSEFMSLDGVIQDPGGAENFEYGGWTMPYWSAELGSFKFDELAASDALLLGRKTYQAFAAAWPSMTDEQGFAERMNGNTKYVLSTTLTAAPEWNNSIVVNGDLVEEITKLKEQPGKDLLVAGSATLVQALMRHNLVDDLRLAVYPIVLGTGLRLFGEGGYTKLELVEQRPTSSGVLLVTYRKAE